MVSYFINHRMGLLLIGFVLILLHVSILEAGSIKKWVDANGKVHFGDASPQQTATQEVNVQNQTVSAKPIPKIAAPLQTKQERLASEEKAKKKQLQEARKKRTEEIRARAQELRKDYRNTY